jgi:hypothetical protein
VLRRRTPKRPHLNNTDRFLFVWLYRWFPSILEAVAIVRPETIIRWHRAGFRAYWRWRSRNRVGRPKVSAELRTLIGEMSRANALWGAPRIHGELLKLGFEVAQSTVARYMCPRQTQPRSGSRVKSPRRSRGTTRRDISFGIETPRMVRSSCSGSVPWAFGTIRSHPDRPGKMLTLRDSSARSAANVWTT